MVALSEAVLLYALLGATATTPVLAEQQEPIAVAQESACPSPQLSCPTSTPSDVDTCCVNSPGGLFLQTQFWDASPSLGPADAWTIHGLWPDLCNGGYDASCDSSRDLTDVKSALLAASSSATELVDFMSQYWLSINGDNNDLWAHEWNKHGTCVSTLEPTCYGESTSSANYDDSSSNSTSTSSTWHQDALDYFTRAVELYRARNTYAALAAANIVPSTEQTYALSDLQAAVSAIQGADVTFRCQSGRLSEIWYHFRVRGPLRDAPTFSASSSSSSSSSGTAAAAAASVSDTGIFVPTSPTDGTKSNCPASGISYPPKSSSSSSSTD